MKKFPVAMKCILMTVLILAFLIPLPAFAQGPLYLAIKPGIYSPQSGSLDHFDTGFSGEVGFGYRINPYLAAELGIGFFYTEGEKTVTNGTTSEFRDFDISVLPITLTVKAILPYQRWEFFGMGGGGVYIASVPHDLEDHDYHDHHHDDDHDYHYDARLGGFLGAGVNYHISRRFFVGVEGKYLWTDKVKVTYEEFGARRDLEFRLDGIIATAVIGIKF